MKYTIQRAELIPAGVRLIDGSISNGTRLRWIDVGTEKYLADATAAAKAISGRVIRYTRTGFEIHFKG